MLLSSHILAEVEHLCDRVSIIRSGRCVESGTLAELRHLTRTSMMADLGGPSRGADGRLPGVHDLKVDGNRVHFRGRHRRPGQRTGCRCNRRARSLTSQPPTLEDLFLRHYGDEVRPEPEERPA